MGIDLAGPALDTTVVTPDTETKDETSGGIWVARIKAEAKGAATGECAPRSCGGCDVGCSFCIVPPMEGRTFTLIPDFTVRPILCDNNLSGLPANYQDYIIARYRMAGIPLLDANSGFEPRTFDEETFERWKPINKGPWRFALDDQGDLPHAIKVLKMLKDRVPSPKKKRVYVLIGNEPYAACMERIRLVIEHGAEPHVQYEMKLNAEVKEPWVKEEHAWAKANPDGWTEEKLRDVARWANGFVWRKVPFEQYDKSRRNEPRQPRRAVLGQ